MKIAVTGALGQLGSQLVRQFGAEAVALDLPDFDLTDPAGITRRLLDCRPDVVINTAAHTQVDRAETEPQRAWAINAEGLARLVEVCRMLDARLVQISTDYVFGGDATRTTPYLETDRPWPVNVYGQTKLEAERLAAEWPKHLIVRTCGLYGPPAPRGGGNFVQTMLRLAETKKRLAVVDDQHVGPSYAPHVARAIGFLVRRGATGIYHVVNRGATTWHGFAAELFRLVGGPVELSAIRTDQYPTAARRPGYSLLDTGRYDALVGRWPLPDWREALAEHVRTESLGLGRDFHTTLG